MDLRGLSQAWRGDAIVPLRNYFFNHIDVDICHSVSSNKWRFTSFYGTHARGRANSWSLLKSLNNMDASTWMIGGDFDEILYSYENVVGVPPN